jgi:uncharacterized membrane protein YccC
MPRQTERTKGNHAMTTPREIAELDKQMIAALQEIDRFDLAERATQLLAKQAEDARDATDDDIRAWVARHSNLENIPFGDLRQAFDDAHSWTPDVRKFDHD